MEPYSIKRWKSETGLSEIDMDIAPQPAVMKSRNRKKSIKKNEIKVAEDKKLMVPELLELTPLDNRRHERELYSMLNMWGPRTNNKILKDLWRPDPYPSSSALQQSFAMICDAYSSSDSGIGDGIIANNDRNRINKDSYAQPVNYNNEPTSMTVHRFYEEQIPARSRSRKINNDYDEIPIRDVTEHSEYTHARKPYPSTLRESYDAQGYYISKGAIQAIKQKTSKQHDYENVGHGGFNDVIIRSNYSNHHVPRTAYTVIDFERNKKRKNRDRRESRRANTIQPNRNSINFLNGDKRGGRSKERSSRRMTRAKSVGEGLGRLSKSEQTISKKELIEWRRKFGEQSASKMMTGLQKLQDAFAKGITMKDTYGYPTVNGRYVKA